VKEKDAMFLTKFLANLKVRRKLGLLMGLVMVGFAALFYASLYEIDEVRDAFPLYAKALANAHDSERLALLRVTLGDIHTLIARATYTTDVEQLQRLQRKARGLSNFAHAQFGDLLQTTDDDFRTSLLAAKLTWEEFWLASEAVFQALLQGGGRVLDHSDAMQRLRQERFTEQLESLANDLALQNEDLTQQANAAAAYDVRPGLLISFGIVLVVSCW
jgi:hypothetical protein